MKSNNYYQIKINKVIDYINTNLDQPIRISKLAGIAGFSSFHFQRIFKAIQNETPYETLFRLRLEKSIFILKHHPKQRLIDVALECGFPSIENFSRQFKSRFNVTPSYFRKDKKLQNSSIYQDSFSNSSYYLEPDKNSNECSFNVVIEQLDTIPIAYIRAIFGDDGSILIEKYERLINWAKANEIDYQGELKRFGMSIDNMDVTPKEQYRYDFAVSINKNIKPEGIIEIGEIPEGLYATIHCIGDLQLVTKNWEYLYKHWLPISEYIPRHYPAIEEFVQGPEQIGWGNFNIKCRIPVKRKE